MIAWLRRLHVLHDWQVRYPSAFALVQQGWRGSRDRGMRTYTCRTCGLIKRYEEVAIPLRWHHASPRTYIWERIYTVDEHGRLAKEYDPIIVEANARAARRKASNG